MKCSIFRTALFAVAIANTSGATACIPFGSEASLRDAPTRLSVSFQRPASAAPRSVELTAFYRRPSSNTAVVLGSISQSLQSGTSDVPFDIDLTTCLTDNDGPRNGGACPVFVRLILRDDSQALVDSLDIGPLVARPGATVTASPAPLATPTSVGIDRTVSSLGASVGDNPTFVANVRDAGGRRLPSYGAQWSSSATSVLTINSATGLASAISAGVSRIRVTVNGFTDSADVAVLGAATVAACAGPFDPIPSLIERDTTLGGLGKRLRTSVNVVVQGNAKLRIAAGTTVCAGPGHFFSLVAGTLDAIGTATNKIRFLGESNASGWNGIALDGTPTDSSRLVFVEFGNLASVAVNRTIVARHPLRLEDAFFGPSPVGAITLSINGAGGAGALLRRVRVEDANSATPNGTAVVLGDSTIADGLTIIRARGHGLTITSNARSALMDLRNVTIQGATGFGLRATDFGPRLRRIDGLEISGGASYPVVIPPTATGMLPIDAIGAARLTGNARDSIWITNGDVAAGDTLYAVGPLPWIFQNSFSIPAAAQLRVGPGGRLVFGPAVSLVLTGGSLEMNGSATQPAVLTARSTTLGWGGVQVSGAGSWNIDRGLLEYTRNVPGLATSPFGGPPRFTRSVFRRFAAPSIFSQLPGVIIEDSRFEEPAVGGFGLIQSTAATGTIFELRRSVIYGAGSTTGSGAVYFQNGGAGIPTRIVIDSVTIDSIGGRGIVFQNAVIPPQLITLRGINFTRIAGQAINWPSITSTLNATGLWYGSPSTPPSATSLADPTPSSIWNAAFVNISPVATSPHVFPEPPRAPASILSPRNARVKQ